MWLYYLLIVYLIVSAVFASSIRNTKVAKIYYITITMGLLAFLSMFRSINVGHDTNVYASLFYRVNASPNILAFAGRFEMGYIYLNKILGYVSNNHQIIFIATSVYIYYIFGRFIYKYSSVPWISVFLFFILGYFALSMNRLREMIVIATILLSYDYIVEKKPIKFIITIIGATLFHTASIVFFAAYPLSKFKLSKKLFFVTLLSTGTACVLFRLILNYLISLFPRYSYYLGGVYLDGEAKTGTAIALLISVLVLIVSEVCNRQFYYHDEGCEKKSIKSICLKNTYDQIQSVFLFIGCAILVIAFNGTIFKRFENLFSVFTIVYLPNSLAKLNQKQVKTLLMYVTLVMFLIYAVIIKLFRPTWNSIYPYTFFWDSIL